MIALTTFLDSWGPWLFLGLGFAEFAGLPIAAIPLLVAGGALASIGAGPAPLAVALLAALGGWIADAIWYGLGYARGARLLRVSCGLSSTRGACALDVAHHLDHVGPGYIAAAKFVPGSGNLVAPAAGMTRFPAPSFLVINAMALVAWAGLWVALGSLLSGPVVDGVSLAASQAPLTLGVAVGLVVAAGAWRAVRVLRHRRLHAVRLRPAVVGGEGGEGARVAVPDVRERAQAS